LSLLKLLACCWCLFHPFEDLFQPFGGFADDLRVDNGYVGLPDSPGVGFERKQALYDVMRRLAA